MRTSTAPSTAARLFALLLLPGLTACGESVEVTASEVCDTLVACEITSDHGECVTSSEPGLRRAEDLGCAREADAANRCTIEQLEADCDADLTVACETVYDEYATCVGEGGAETDFACDGSDDPSTRLCTQYRNNPNDPATTCDALGGEPTDACPAEGVVARCTIAGATTTTELHYYDPLPTGLTLETLESICAMQDGTFTTE
ncbi:MAG TPA: hypothetical protein RMH99_11070 [Sandaracinaceae bacterium LLY-WYZ-13_1]|nr:hypothetical protein [Sandaracinaceae bacterium LLY-WYZ-13_1]